MNFTKFAFLGDAVTTNAVLRCYETHMCAAVQSCGAGNDTATINSENYEAVKAANTPSTSSPNT